MFVKNPRDSMCSHCQFPGQPSPPSDARMLEVLNSLTWNDSYQWCDVGAHKLLRILAFQKVDSSRDYFIVVSMIFHDVSLRGKCQQSPDA